jgi:hypothetical protein
MLFFKCCSSTALGLKGETRKLSKSTSVARDLQDVSASALALLAAGADQLTAARRSPYNLNEWPTSSRRTPPTTKPRPAFTNYCLLPTHSRPVAVCLCFCLAHHKYRLLISSLLGSCPALAQGFSCLTWALRCDHSLIFFSSTPAATFYPPLAMRAACT